MARMFGWIGVFIDRVDRALQGRKREPRARFVFWVLVFGHLPDWKCLILCLWNRACARGCGFVGRCYRAGYCGFAGLFSVGGTGGSPRLGNHSLGVFWNSYVGCWRYRTGYEY